MSEQSPDRQSEATASSAAQQNTRTTRGEGAAEARRVVDQGRDRAHPVQGLMAEQDGGAGPTAEPAGSDAEPGTGRPAEEKDAGDDSPPSGYADFEPATTPG